MTDLSRYDQLGPIARALVDDYDEIDLAAMLVKAQDDLATLRTVSRGYCPACGRGDAAPTVADWEQQKTRADQAEAALTAARRAARGIGAWGVLQAAETPHQQSHHRFTARPVDPDMERAATERARQAATDSEHAAEQLAALNPPGSTREQLPDEVLAAIQPGPYLSTACHAAFLCETSEPTEELAGWPQRLHARCRINNKFTGRLCVCGCHGEAAPAGTEATDTTKEQ